MSRNESEMRRYIRNFGGIRIGMQYFAESNDDNKKDDGQDGDDAKDDTKSDDSGNDSNNASDGGKNDDKDIDKKTKSVYEQFGMNEEQIKELIKAKKEKDEAEKDNATKLAEAIAEKAKSDAKVNAMMLGAKPECVDDVISLAMTKQNEGKDFKNVVSEIKKKYPNMFTDGSENQGKKGTGSTFGNKGKGDTKTESLGQRLAKKRTLKTKSKFFN